MENQTLSQALISKSWKYFITVGVIVAVAGLGATSLPVMAGVTISTIIGTLLLITGLVQVYHTFHIHFWKEKLWYVLSALFYIVGAVFILFKPLEGLMTITTIMVVVMIFNGLTRMIFGFTNKNLPGSGMVILSGLLSVVIGGYFFSLFDNPEFSLSLLGTFVGVSLLIEGISFIFLGLRMKKLVNNQ
ncbi:HdeD family acid-resistance protein [Aliivibrio fischeri]|uniref:HdeD family acid-resistance protein n=1 Tax=Aliivibrio fischeri TaxID=668 RepID=A0A6N3Z8E2_ALIFS|nr:DUF308 domain-containing protein [Aliivibrio fischeri]MUJ20269.1 HdeD family acid-resistance protein [Aliivibrio fischeri]MUJ27227.1 HdeD family acid-resistance protein [Aliivibrio fischeri]MUK39494.1 HdeD family acid-resistance protein [Aliivibrio fischeri]MUK46285.1 HdeD family acid-resistance protein [Aliivibrio fischeri]MUK82002.1 HdeD family acid-resistance protein [Aliivibrio fischeri]